MNKKTKPSTYESPLVLEEALNLEQGFAQSPTSNYGLKHISGDDVQDDSDSWN